MSRRNSVLLFVCIIGFAGCSPSWPTLPFLLLPILFMGGCIIGSAVIEGKSDLEIAEIVAEEENGRFCSDGGNWILYLGEEVIVNGNNVTSDDPCEPMELPFSCDQDGNLVYPEEYDSGSGNETTEDNYDSEYYSYSDSHYYDECDTKSETEPARRLWKKFQEKRRLLTQQTQEAASKNIQLRGDGW